MSTANSPATDPHAATLATLERVLGGEALRTTRFRDNLRLFVPANSLVELLRALKGECGFSMLTELGATDYLGYPGRSGPRFEVHYVVRNLETSEWLAVKAGVDDPDPTLPSVVS